MTSSQDLTPTLSHSPPLPAVCGNCGADEGRLLHHLRNRGIFRRLCTTCVLRLNPIAFCPTCFSSPPVSPAVSVTCSKCYSSSHPECTPTTAPSTTTPYICPPCRNPSSPIFNPKRTSSGVKEIDMNSARVLLAAARIAALSMGNAAVAARAEAERRAKEAALTRKRAREALEHVAYLVGKDKAKSWERPLVVEAPGNAVDGPSEVSARLNAVGLRENESVNPSNGWQHTPNKLVNGGEGNIAPQ